MTLKESKQIATTELKELHIKGNNILKEDTEMDFNTYKEAFEQWREQVSNALRKCVEEDKVIRFEGEAFYQENGFSKASTRTEISKAHKNGIRYLSWILDKLSDEGELDNDIPKEIAVVIVRRLLKNFYKHIEVMYQEKPHQSGSILKTDLDKIRIGNEYDVQRILYSLIKPVFPLARVEVSSDTGCGSVRYDIFLDEYDMVIEVKCTRDSMKEKDLREQIASDAFHYQCSRVFFFIYDKEKIIKNIDVFIRAYCKVQSEKTIETVVIQPLIL